MSRWDFRLTALLLVLAATAALGEPSTDLIRPASAAAWRNANEALTFGGNWQFDSQGSAVFRRDVRVGGQPYAYVLATHPQWAADGMVEGRFPVELAGITDPVFRGQVAILWEQTAGAVFVVEAAERGSEQRVEVCRARVEEGDVAVALEGSLAAFAGKAVDLYLRVNATEQGAAYCHAAWLTARVGPAAAPPDRVYVTDLAPIEAAAGWSDDGSFLPRLDRSIEGRPLTLAGTAYERGIGTQARSSLTFPLGGKYARFRAAIGLDDEIGKVLGSASFYVFLDGQLAYLDRPLITGEAPRSIEVPVYGVQELRLAVVEGDVGTSAHADWADATLEPLATAPTDEQMREQIKYVTGIERLRRDGTGEVEQQVRMLERREGHLARTMVPGEYELRVAAEYLPDQGQVVLTNHQLSVTFGIAGPQKGLLSVYQVPEQELVIAEVAPSVVVQAGVSVPLRDMILRPCEVVIGDCPDGGLGPGKIARIPFLSADQTIGGELWIGLYLDSPYFTYRIMLSEKSARPVEPGFELMRPSGAANVLLGAGPVRAIWDRSYLRDERLCYTDTMSDVSSQGGPLLLANEREGRGLVLGSLDWSRPPRLTVDRPVDQAGADVWFSAYDGWSVASPWLYVEPTGTTDARQAFAGFRTALERLYPPLQLPPWVRYQWLSWYPAGTDVSDDYMREEVKALKAQFGDLGAWHVVLDSGWWVPAGDPRTTLLEPDARKFPRGMRDLVDYTHSQGMDFVLYLNVPGVQSAGGEEPLQRARVQENYTNWLLPVAPDSWTFDFFNAHFRDYLEGVLYRFYGVYGVDGMKLDGVGSGGAEQIAHDLSYDAGIFGTSDSQVLEIYQLAHDLAAKWALHRQPYIESCWSTSPLADPYCHTFRFGDESPNFDYPYSLGGLRQHLDYALYQGLALGQRANMGALTGGPQALPLHLDWLQAALATGAQTSLSFDVRGLPPAALAQYRAALSQYRPFAGETHYGAGFPPSAVATTTGGLTFAAAINRGPAAVPVALDLKALGVPAPAGCPALDVDRLQPVQLGPEDTVEVPPQSVSLYALRREAGMLWTDCSFTMWTDDGLWGDANDLVFEVRGPADLPGFAYLYAPGTRGVWVDGNVLPLLDSFAATGEGWALDKGTGLVVAHFALTNKPRELRLVGGAPLGWDIAKPLRPRPLAPATAPTRPRTATASGPNRGGGTTAATRPTIPGLVGGQGRGRNTSPGGRQGDRGTY